METNWVVDTADGAKIYGVKNAASENKAKQAIFIVHGLTGHVNEYAFKRAADYFSPEYDVYRFNLYGGEDDARNLVDCTIATHAADLNTVLATFAEGYAKVFLIGHSYGGPTVTMANPNNITAASLWDPTFDATDLRADLLPIADMHMTDWGVNSLIGKAMYDEAGVLDTTVCTKLATDCKFPVQVVHADDGTYVKQEESYHSYGDSRNIREVVEGTEHCFYEGTTCDELLQKTANWFKQF